VSESFVPTLFRGYWDRQEKAIEERAGRASPTSTSPTCTTRSLSSGQRKPARSWT